MKIIIEKTHPDAVIPKVQTKGAACVDLVAVEVIVTGRHAVVKFGLKSVIPQGWCVTLQPRSSFSWKGWIMANSPGQIDSDYRGEWMAKFEAIPQDIGTYIMSRGPYFRYSDFPYKVEDRAIQAKLERVEPMEFEEGLVDETERGEGSFGSTDIVNAV